jgi:ubiquinone/menaquinone biosynthesis C-methylase UbiE
MSVTITKAIADNYTECYRPGKYHMEWRSLGAIDKCANIRNLCAHVRHENVVEIGCGDGALIERLSSVRFSSRFKGLEISSTALEQARQKHLAGADFELFNGYATRFADHQFDLAILSHVVEHVEHPRQLLYEALRVAKTVFVEVPLEDTLRLPRDFVFNSTGHINFYNVATIRSLVQSCGARILAARLSHSSRSTYQYRLGRVKGTLAHGLKEAAIRYMSAVVPRFLTCHYALTCQRCEN